MQGVLENDSRTSLEDTWLTGNHRKPELLHIMGTVGTSRVEAGLLIRLGRVLQQFSEGQNDIANVIVGGDLVPIEDAKMNVEVGLIAADVEEKLLVPFGIQRMADDASTEDLLAKGDDHERIHIPTRTSHYKVKVRECKPQMSILTHCFVALEDSLHQRSQASQFLAYRERYRGCIRSIYLSCLA
jgi:hypothetical protein